MDPKLTTRKDQYREQRARGAYIAMICQPEATFDLSMAAQHQEPTDADIAALNKRIKWQMEHLDREIRYVKLDLDRMKLFVFIDSLFANNKDFSSQIGYKIIIANETTRAPYDNSSFRMRGNLVHYNSTKSKRVTRSVLALEIYSMVRSVNIAIAINITIKMITNQLELLLMPIIIYTNSYLLYK